MFSPDQIAEITKGKILRSTDAQVTRVVHDSRIIKPGDVFIAIKGNRVDGHSFLRQVFKSGASAAVISDRSSIPDNASNLIVVDDTIDSLQRLAASWRQSLDATFVGITGTCGKTTTRSLLFHLLSGKMQAYCAPENFNTEIGLPLALLGMPTGPQVGIFELGTTQPGDIRTLAKLLSPDIGVITLAGRGHLAGLKDVESVAQEKWDLIRGLPKDGKAFINVDCPALARLAGITNANITTVGLETADLSAAISITEKGLVIDTRDPHLHLQTKLLGTHNATNVLLAIAVALKLGLEKQEIETRISTFQPFAHRLNLLEASFGYILDDSYNANPESTRAALMTLAGMKLKPELRAFVFGDMLGLGVDAVSYHEELLELALNLGIMPIFPIGKLSTQAAMNVSYRRPTTRDCFIFCQREKLTSCIQSSLADRSSIVLIKGSHDIGLTDIVEKLSCI